MDTSKKITFNKKIISDVHVYYLQDSTIFEFIDVWIFMNISGKIDAIRIGASFKDHIKSFDPNKLGIFAQSLGLAQINTGYVKFSDRKSAIKIIGDFLRVISEVEGVEEGQLSDIKSDILSLIA